MLIESIHKKEINSAYSKGMLTLATMTIEDELKSRYSVKHTICNDNCHKYCLYLYLYAASNWCSGEYNFITEQDMINIINKIEQMQRMCCAN